MSMLFPDVLIADSLYESTNMTSARTYIPLAVGFQGALADGMEHASDLTQPPWVYAPAGVNGSLLVSSMEGWYYRIHFIPYSFDLGNLSGDQERDMVLWNAFFVPVNMTDFVLVNGEGITVTASIDAPAIIPALQTVDYTFAVSGSGPAIIDATATWTIDGEVFEVPITGRRTTLFGFSPNWKTAVKETLEWQSTVNAAFAGNEQRMSTRDEPRRIFEYQWRLHGEEVNLFDVMTFGWTGRMFSLPLWHEKTNLTAAATLGATTLYLATLGVTFAPDSTAILYVDSWTSEAIEILEVYSDRIVLKGPLLADWPQGSVVVPTLVCAPPEDFATARRADTHLDSGGRFTASPTDCFPRLPVVPAAVLYRGEELYTGETNWRSALNISVESRRTVVDNKRGPMRVKPKATFPLITRGFSWLLKSRAVAEDLRAFFVRRKGRVVPVWMPSGQIDFTLAAPIPLGQSSFLVKRTQYRSFVDFHEARRDLIFIMRNGARYTRRINSMADVGADVLVQVDEDFPVIVTDANIKRISYLGLYRLGADAVTFNWWSDRVAEVDVQFVLTEPSL